MKIDKTPFDGATVQGTSERTNGSKAVFISRKRKAKKFNCEFSFVGKPFTDEELSKKIAEVKGYISLLRVRGCPQITLEGMRRALVGCSNLHTLVFFYHEAIFPSSDWLQAIQRQAPSLRQLMVHSVLVDVGIAIDLPSKQLVFST